MALVELENVSKIFHRQRGARILLGRGGLGDLVRRKTDNALTALDDINLTVNPGECVGLIGANGSGKSTLLKVIGGVTLPTTGTVTVRGRIASLLELGAGFHHMLTGRENIFLNGGLLGMRHRDVRNAFDSIVSFSGIGEFIDDPVNTYSSGMYVRLAFSVAVHSNPDVFLLDEVLAVGDEEFQRKCRARIGELKASGKTLIFVSHDLGIVNSICDRCYLLTKGKMISRGSPQATIDYYVRQVGTETSVHTFRQPPVEGIFCHGRLSLFWEGNEVSAPRGFQLQIMYLNHWYNTTDAEWRMAERRDDGCTVRGEMPTLPVVFEWDFTLSDGRLTWSVAMECTKDVTLDEFEANLFLPTTYAEWTYEGMTGEFPEILPSDLAWVMVVAPEFSGHEAGAIPEAGSSLPALYAQLITDRPFLRLRWQNTDYGYGSRVLQTWGRFPASDSPLRTGRYELLTLELDLSGAAEDVRAKAAALDADQAVHTPKCVARFEYGRMHLYAGGRELTALVFLHTSVCIGQLWSDSQHLQCDPPERRGDTIYMTASSPRFPFREHFEVRADGDDIELRVWLEAIEDVEVTAYRMSIGLQTVYDQWECGGASGPFPESSEGAVECSAKNDGYALRATSPELPAVTLTAHPADFPWRMTAANTGAKIIQAVRRPDDGAIRFPKGKHLLFSGTVSVDDSPTQSR